MAAYYSPLAEDLASGKLPWGTEKQETVQGKEKIFLVTDTSWWLEEGWYSAVDIAEKTSNVFFVIPGGVLKELDGLKKNDNLARRSKALYATKQIKELLEKGKGKIITNGKKREFGCLNSIVDEEVISVAKALNKEGKNVIVLTTDYAQTALGKNENITTSKTLDTVLLKDSVKKDITTTKATKKKGITPSTLLLICTLSLPLLLEWKPTIALLLILVWLIIGIIYFSSKILSYLLGDKLKVYPVKNNLSEIVIKDEYPTLAESIIHNPADPHFDIKTVDPEI